MPNNRQARPGPQRTCIACRKTADKSELVRLVRRPDGVISRDLQGRIPGRGAYICNSSECIDRGLRGGRIGQALRVTIEREQIDQLLSQLAREEGKKEVSS